MSMTKAYAEMSEQMAKTASYSGEPIREEAVFDRLSRLEDEMKGIVNDAQEMEARMSGLREMQQEAIERLHRLDSMLRNQAPMHPMPVAVRSR